MNRLEIPAKNLDVTYPSTWDEIGTKNLARIGEILHMGYTGKADYDMIRKLAVDEFLNRVNKPNKPMFGEKSLTYWGNESILADTVDWLFKKEKDKKGGDMTSINPKFCKQLVPRVRVGWRLYKGPKDLLADLTIFDFKEASWRVGKFSETKDEDFLNELFAVLYYTGRKRKVDEKVYCRTRRDARRVPIGTRFMIFLFFLGCMNWMREEAIEIDGREIHFGCLFNKSEAEGGEEGGETGMAGIVFQMAESGVFGNVMQTNGVNMWDIFLRLYQIHYQVKKMK